MGNKKSNTKKNNKNRDSIQNPFFKRQIERQKQAQKSHDDLVKRLHQRGRHNKNRNNNNTTTSTLKKSKSPILKKNPITEEMKEKSRRVFQRFSNLQDYYIKFCDYPCAKEMQVGFH